ncbi:inner membrane protein [Escherichia coli]|nr:inner membrane protein [Escherichia coli]
MAQVINEMDVPSHSFVFHGTGERYFLICVVNVLLTIITLGTDESPNDFGKNH